MMLILHIHIPTNHKHTERQPHCQATPDFILQLGEKLATDFSPHLQDKIWEWPGNEATKSHWCHKCLYYSGRIKDTVLISTLPQV